MSKPRPRPLSPSQSRPVPRRGLSRIEAAWYIGVSPSKFDQWVDDGRMPQPKCPDGPHGRKLWDIRELDVAFEALGEESQVADNTWGDFE